MPKFYDSKPRREVRIGGGKVSSFYGVCGRTTVKMHPNVSFDAPINDLYGPHLRFEYAKDKE